MIPDSGQRVFREGIEDAEAQVAGVLLQEAEVAPIGEICRMA
jgi:hypothetical protein